MKIKHPPLFIAVCLAFGGIGTIGVICFFIGFGLHSTVGKYAIYVAFFLELLSLLADFFTNKRYTGMQKNHIPSVKMRRFRLISAIVWFCGATLLLSSLGLILGGMNMTARLPRYFCLFGCLLAPMGWLGLLMSSHRQRQALQVLNSQG